MLKGISVILAITSITGCAATYNPEFTKTGSVTVLPQNSDCDVSIYTTTPKVEFDELGIIDISYSCFVAGCNKEMRKASGVVEIVRAQVCQAGGNAILLWQATGYGEYKKATVVRTN